MVTFSSFFLFLLTLSVPFSLISGSSPSDQTTRKKKSPKAKAKSLRPPSPPSSSSKPTPTSRYQETEAGDELPFVRHASITPAIYCSEPFDRLKNNDPTYVRITDRVPFSGVPLDTLIGDILKMEAPAATPSDTAKLLESEHVEEINKEWLHYLPRIYLQKRAFLPWYVFLHRFRYPAEFDEPNYSTPIGCLATFFVADPKADMQELSQFFKVLLQTQKTAIQSYEFFYLNLLMGEGLRCLPLLKLYFEHAVTEKTSSILNYLLLYARYEEYRTPEGLKQLLLIPNYNPNARVNPLSCPIKTDDSFEAFKFDDEDYSILSLLLVNKNVPPEMIKCLIGSGEVDTCSPSGIIYVQSTMGANCFIRFVNRPLFFLALIFANYEVCHALIAAGRLTGKDVYQTIFYYFIFIVWKVFVLFTGYPLGIVQYKPRLHQQ